VKAVIRSGWVSDVHTKAATQLESILTIAAESIAGEDSVNA